MSIQSSLQREKLISRIEELFENNSTGEFHGLAFDVFRYQVDHNDIYSKWVKNFNRNPNSLGEIPKMHISAWKNHVVKSGDFDAESIFESSKTRGNVASRHFVRDTEFYKQISVRSIENIYGKLEDYCILGLLPSYLERKGSSLVSMVQCFIEKSSFESSGTYLDEHQKLYSILLKNREDKIPTILIGVSFGLLDFLDSHQLNYSDLIVMETGGMKGRREELSKTKLHEKLSLGFGVRKVHSEYGMTELLSQAYSQGDGIYTPAVTMRILVTEINDPLTRAPYGKVGIINVIDLANLDTCSFICTDDLGIEYEDGSFSIIGRLDESDIRGCNLMVSDL